MPALVLEHKYHCNILYSLKLLNVPLWQANQCFFAAIQVTDDQALEPRATELSGGLVT